MNGLIRTQSILISVLNSQWEKEVCIRKPTKAVLPIAIIGWICVDARTIKQMQTIAAM
jgi:hypothetical protein